MAERFHNAMEIPEDSEEILEIHPINVTGTKKRLMPSSAKGSRRISSHVKSTLPNEPEEKDKLLPESTVARPSTSPILKNKLKKPLLCDPSYSPADDNDFGFKTIDYCN